MQVVILAAGQGTRMRPLTHDRPKSMLNVAGRPLLAHVLEAVKDAGFEEAILVVGHGDERIRSTFGDGNNFGVKLGYVQQEKQLGPGHALMQARGEVAGEDFLLLPADAWFHPRLLQRLAKSDGPALIQVPDARSGRYGVPVVKKGRVVSLEEGEGLPCGGAYRLPTRIFERLSQSDHHLVESIREDLAEHGPWICVAAEPREYVDVIEVEDLLDLHGRLMEKVETKQDGSVAEGVHVEGAVHIGEGSVVHPGCVLRGPIHIGDHCEVGPSVVLQPGTAIRNRVRVEPFVVLGRVALSSNVTIGSHSRLQAAVVDNGATVGAGARIDGGRGVILGADARLEADVTLQAGSRIGRQAHVGSGRVVGDVPDGGVAL